MFAVRLISRCTLESSRRFTTISGGLSRSQISWKTNKDFAVIKRPYQTRTSGWRTWDAVEKPAGITGRYTALEATSKVKG